MLAYNDSAVIFYVSNAIPRMLSYFINGVSVARVCIKDLLDEIFAVRTYKLGNLIVGIQDFFI